PVRHDRYGVPNAPRFPYLARSYREAILELPPMTLGISGTTNRPAAGGGHFRLFPQGEQRSDERETERHPTVLPCLYFHPWGFDPGQPRLPLGGANRFRTYVGIPRCRPRLRKLLARYGSRRMVDAVTDLELRKDSLSTFPIVKAD